MQIFLGLEKCLEAIPDKAVCTNRSNINRTWSLVINKSKGFLHALQTAMQIDQTSLTAQILVVRVSACSHFIPPNKQTWLIYHCVSVLCWWLSVLPDIGQSINIYSIYFHYQSTAFALHMASTWTIESDSLNCDKVMTSNKLDAK